MPGTQLLMDVPLTVNLIVSTRSAEPVVQTVSGAFPDGLSPDARASSRERECSRPRPNAWMLRKRCMSEEGQEGKWMSDEGNWNFMVNMPCGKYLN